MITQPQPQLRLQCVLLVMQSLRHVEHGGGGDGAHAVDGVAAVHGHRLVGVGGEGEDVARPDLLAVFEPPECGGGDAHHLALQGHRARLRQSGRQLLEEHGSLVTLGHCNNIATLARGSGGGLQVTLGQHIAAGLGDAMLIFSRAGPHSLVLAISGQCQQSYSDPCILYAWELWALDRWIVSSSRGHCFELGRCTIVHRVWACYLQV